MRSTTTKAVTLPDDHWAVLEREAHMAAMYPDKLLAHCVRLMQRDQSMARQGLTLAYVNDRGEIHREEPIGLPAFD